MFSKILKYWFHYRKYETTLVNVLTIRPGIYSEAPIHGLGIILDNIQSVSEITYQKEI